MAGRKVAFLGLGVMGQGMASNLLKAGHRVTVWNRSAGRSGDLVEQGAKEAGSPSEAVQGAEVIMYCLSDDQAVEDLVFGKGGILAVAGSGQTAIDMSTVHPRTSLKQAEAYRERGVDFLDAPVFGSRNEAAAGGLWIVVGGEKNHFATVEPLLQSMAETVHHMGPVGKGTSMKLVGNLIVAAQLEALGEAMVLATKAGLRSQDVLDVLKVTDFRSPIFDGVGSALIARDFSTNFALKHMMKDTNLIARFAAELHSPTPAANAARESVKAAMNQGWGEENASALIKALELLGKTEVQAD